MKRFIALMLLLAMALSLAACGGKAEAPAATEKPVEEKKALPVATQPAEEDVPAETHYRDIMIPFEEIMLSRYSAEHSELRTGGFLY